jgi:hypothetical protein
MAGFSTGNNQHLIRANIWDPEIKEIFEDTLFATKYVDYLTGFPDGDTINIPSIGQMEVLDYQEGEAIRYTGMDTGNFTMSITEYKSSATYITNKMKQDSFYTAKLVSKFVPSMARAIAVAMEVDALAVGPDGQTVSDLNTINGGDHRFVASGTSQVMTTTDFARAKYALQKANVPMTNLVALVDPSVEFEFSTLTNLVNMNMNPRWEGIVKTGLSTGMRFITHVFGFDVYTSNNLKSGISETIDSVAVTNGVANLFFSAAPEALPYVGAVRQSPKVDSDYNKDLQREEYVTTCRYVHKLYRPEAQVVILSDSSQVG